MPLSPYQQTQLARYGNQAKASTAELEQMPVEYATGRAEFAGLPLHVSPAVLIPRIETEELVELVLQTIAEQLPVYQTAQSLKIAEVGTGSGAISIVVVKHLAYIKHMVTITAGDISQDALAVARQNQTEFLSPNDAPVTFIESDLLKNFDRHAFDIIVANLPYIPTERLRELDHSVTDYEPNLALDGGPRGLTLIYKLIDQAIVHLRPGGVLLLEIDESHSVVDFREFGQYFEVMVIQDSFGKNRFAKLTYIQQPFQA